MFSKTRSVHVQRWRYLVECKFNIISWFSFREAIRLGYLWSKKFWWKSLVNIILAQNYKRVYFEFLLGLEILYNLLCTNSQCLSVCHQVVYLSLRLYVYVLSHGIVVNIFIDIIFFVKKVVKILIILVCIRQMLS